jgi:hypothetical protein
MNLTEKIQQIKKVLFDTAAPADAPGKAYKLQDGTDVIISELKEGGDVVINGAPAKAGDYVLNDGTAFTIDKDGKIAALTPAAAEGAAEAVKKEMRALFAANKKELDDAKALIAKQDKALKLMFETIQLIGREPTGESPEDPRARFSFNKAKEKADYKSRMMQAVGEAIK